MPEYSGSLPSFELALSLWLAPLLPLVAAIYAGLGGYVAGGDDRALPRSFRPRFVTLAASVAALGLTGFHLAVLFGLPAKGRQLVSHAWGMQRIGSLDTSFTVSGDTGTLALAAVICAAACAALLLPAPDDAERRLAAGVGLGLAGGLAVLLGDDLPLVIAGSFASGLGALVLAPRAAGARAARGFALGRVGDAALIGAAALLLWGLGGSWTGEGDYVPDFRPRLVAVQQGAAPAVESARGVLTREGVGSISMAALPGASLVLGGADLCAVDPDGKRGGVGTNVRPCRELARSPFSRLPVPVALHDVEVRTGPGTHDLLVEKLRVNANVETTIALAGATSGVRELRDQMAIRDSSGGHLLRSALAKKKFLGQPLLGLVGALLATFALFRSLAAAWSVSMRAAAEASAPTLVALAAGLELCLAAALLSRIDFLFAFVPTTASVLAAGAALLAFVAAAQASHGFSLRRSLVLIAVANGALSTAACVLGARAPALVGLVVSALGLLSVALASDAEDLERQAGSAASHQRVLALAALAMSGAPLPALGVFWAREGLLAAGATLGSVVGYVVLAASAAASGALAFAAWRVHFLLTQGKAKAKEQAGRGSSWALALAALGALVGALAHPALVTGLPPLLESWLSSGAQVDFRGVPLERSVRWAIAAVAFGVGVAGFWLAKARYGATRAKDWVERERERPLHQMLATSPDRFDALVSLPALAVSRALARFDAGLEGLVMGAEVEAPPVSMTQKKGQRERERQEDDA